MSGARQWCAGPGIYIEPTVDEGVKDGHGAVGNTSVRVDLLEYYSDNLVTVHECPTPITSLTFVDVGGVRLLSSLP